MGYHDSRFPPRLITSAYKGSDKKKLSFSVSLHENVGRRESWWWNWLNVSISTTTNTAFCIALHVKTPLTSCLAVENFNVNDEFLQRTFASELERLNVHGNFATIHGVVLCYFFQYVSSARSVEFWFWKLLSSRNVSYTLSSVEKPTYCTFKNLWIRPINVHNTNTSWDASNGQIMQSFCQITRWLSGVNVVNTASFVLDWLSTLNIWVHLTVKNVVT